MRQTSELPPMIVLSHLRWNWVWQRPQHLISRLAQSRQVWFVEEPVAGDLETPRWRTEQCTGLTRMWLEVPRSWPSGFSADICSPYIAALTARLSVQGSPSPDVWLYTPMALDVARKLKPSMLVFDVMDDLAAFRHADPFLKLSHRQALREADLVFTGGRSLHAGVTEVRDEYTFLFPSGVDPEHYGSVARLKRRAGVRPVAGYVGVIDERVDLDLVARLSRELPDWDIHMVGPITKIDESSVPRAANIHYFGMQSYDRLPHVMAAMDVGLMPFALNEATRSISPTKTLEYLAAGLPVVSTAVPDVVSEFGTVVKVCDPSTFAHAVRHPIDGDLQKHAHRVEALLDWHRWDAIALRMAELMGEFTEGHAEVGPGGRSAHPVRVATMAGRVSAARSSVLTKSADVNTERTESA